MKGARDRLRPKPPEPHTVHRQFAYRVLPRPRSRLLDLLPSRAGGRASPSFLRPEHEQSSLGSSAHCFASNGGASSQRTTTPATMLRQFHRKRRAIMSKMKTVDWTVSFSKIGVLASRSFFTMGGHSRQTSGICPMISRENQLTVGRR